MSAVALLDDFAEGDDAEGEQVLVDLVRIEGYAIACSDDVARAAKVLERAIDVMERARRRAERALAEIHAACERAEDASVLYVRCKGGDLSEEERAAVAVLLEDLFG